jgi:formylglycine-generating enzyme required for sulfatase activity
MEQEKGVAETADSVFKECAAVCPLMVVIPTGKFTMGSSEDEVGRTAGEGPRHEVAIAESFAVSKYEVTFDQWDACVAADACLTFSRTWKSWRRFRARAVAERALDWRGTTLICDQ